MSDILDPQGLETAETLQDDNLMGVYQSPSGGVRDNKKSRLDVLRDYFKKLPVFTANNLVQADGTGTLRTTNLSTTEVTNTVTRSQNNETAIGVLDQRVDDNDTDIGNNSNSIGVNAGNISSNDGDISTLQGRATALENKTPQSYKTTDTITLVDLVLTGVASVKDSIISLLSRMTATEGATGNNATNIGNNASDIGNNDTDIGNNASAIGVNSGKITNSENNITALQNKTPQSYKNTDTITLVDLILTGLGNIKGIIQGILDKLDQGVKTTDDVVFKDITATGHTKPTSAPASATWSTTQVIPIGQYNVQFTAPTNSSVGIKHGIGTIMFKQVSAGGSVSPDSAAGGSFYSDGINVTISITGGATAKYWKY